MQLTLLVSLKYHSTVLKKVEFSLPSFCMFQMRVSSSKPQESPWHKRKADSASLQQIEN